MVIKSYFEDIREKIIDEIETARYSIYIAVAWFTDKRLFDLLCDKANSGVKVELIAIKDEINSNTSIDFSVLFQCGGKVWLIEDAPKTMHNKFCIIDLNVVITGSYNWTYNASNNHENVMIISDHSETTDNYFEQFRIIKQKYFGTEKDAYNQLSLRLAALKNLIFLNDINDIFEQINKLKKLSLFISKVQFDELNNAFTLIHSGNYNNAMSYIDNLIYQSNNHITEEEIARNSCRSIFSAAQNDSIIGIRLFLNKGISINKKDNKKNTPLHYAAQNNSLELIKFLINRNAEINQLNNNKQYPIYLLDYKKNNYLECFHLLINNEIINNQDSQENTLLHYAAQNNSLEIIKFLINRKAKINQLNTNNQYPIDMLDYSKDNYLECFQLLLNNNVIIDLNKKTLSNYCYVLDRTKGFDALKTFIDNFPSFNEYISKSYLIDNFNHFRTDTKSYLISKGLNINALNSDNKNLLDDCINFRYKYKECYNNSYFADKFEDVKFLFDNGFNWREYLGEEIFIEILLKNDCSLWKSGMKWNVLNTYNQSPLEFLFLTQSIELITNSHIRNFLIFPSIAEFQLFSKENNGFEKLRINDELSVFQITDLLIDSLKYELPKYTTDIRIMKRYPNILDDYENIIEKVLKLAQLNIDHINKLFIKTLKYNFFNLSKVLVSQGAEGSIVLNVNVDNLYFTPENILKNEPDEKRQYFHTISFEQQKYHPFISCIEYAKRSQAYSFLKLLKQNNLKLCEYDSKNKIIEENNKITFKKIKLLEDDNYIAFNRIKLLEEGKKREIDLENQKLKEVEEKKKREEEEYKNSSFIKKIILKSKKKSNDNQN